MNAVTARTLLALVLLPLVAVAARAQLQPEWIGVVPVGSALTAGLQGSVTDAAGVTYITGVGGSSSNTDIYTAAFAPDGTQLWLHIFNGPADWHDQARGICLAPGGIVYVCGNTPGPGSYADVLLLKYEAATGTLLNTVQFATAPFTSEHVASVAADSLGNVSTGGGTTGDGADGLMLGFDSEGALRWDSTYDGPAWGPYSQDSVQQVQVDGNGDVLAMIHGVMGSNQPDYVMVKYSGLTGDVLWNANWGSSGGDYPTDFVIDAANDIFVTGQAINGVDMFGMAKLSGSDGSLLWDALDWNAFHHSPAGIAVDGNGGVYIAGRSDPDGDKSNFNDNFFTVKRDATTGELRWTHTYGANCVGCFDVADDVIVDGNGNVLVMGSTDSAPYSNDLILFVLDPVTGLEIDRGIVGSAPGQSAGGHVMRLDAADNIYIGGGFQDTTTLVAGMAVFKFGALGSWSNLGNGLTGSAGITPRLAGTGTLSGNSSNQLKLTDALPGTTTSLVVGLTRLDATFKGGTMVPYPDVLLFGMPVDGDGAHTLDFTWPTGVPSGVAIYLQHWIADPAGPAGYSATNGLQGMTP